MPPKASLNPLPELAEFLEPFASHFWRSEGREDLERYSTGLLSDLARKNRHDDRRGDSRDPPPAAAGTDDGDSMG